jgi:hypothetical protein
LALSCVLLIVVGALSACRAGGVGKRTEIDPERQAACRAEAAAFTNYPLVTLGEVGGGHQLAGCHASGDAFSYGYGTCVLRERGGLDGPSCHLPLSVRVEPPCQPYISGRYQPNTILRGVPAYVQPHVVALMAPAFTVEVQTSGSAGSLYAPAIADELEPANQLAAALKPGDPLTVIQPKNVGPRADIPAVGPNDRESCLSALNGAFVTETERRCEREAAEVEKYPLVYVGRRFLNYRLVGCYGQSEDQERYHHFSYAAYGDCLSGPPSPPLGPGVSQPDSVFCESNFELWFYPPCHRPTYESEPYGTIRGVPASKRADRVLVWAPGFNLWFMSMRPEYDHQLMVDVMTRLVPANDLASELDPGEPLTVIPGKDCG